ncbi:MAG: hypothetical protein Q7I95_07720 [Thiobacillus sp.]|nr:hypothetical protein [Thiobacillus sp.]
MGGATARTHAFDDSHRWITAHTLLDAAHDDESRACAVGAISHLWVDIIAHNHFVVPAADQPRARRRGPGLAAGLPAGGRGS